MSATTTTAKADTASSTRVVNSPPSTRRDASQTFLTGVNDRGEVVGFYDVISGRNVIEHGFVYDKGKFDAIDVPGSTSTDVTAINNTGELAGRYTDAHSGQHGFIYDNGKLTTIDVPGAEYVTVTAINSRGEATGFYTDNISDDHGFIYNKGKLLIFDAPGAVVTLPSGINQAGEVVGSYRTGSPNGGLGSHL